MQTAASLEIVVSIDYIEARLKKIATTIRNIVSHKPKTLLLLQDIHLSGAVQAAHITPSQF